MREIPVRAILLLMPAIFLLTGSLEANGDQIIWIYSTSRTISLVKDSPSQAVNGTWLTFSPGRLAFPDVSYENPIIISIQLPEGVKLSQTLATGRRATTSPLPSAGEKVVPLAVYEFTPPSKTGEEAPAAIAGVADLGPHAVQLFRYVAGESHIWIRINESSTKMIPSSTSRRIGFTIGVGGGVLPNTADSNWGRSGIGRQAPSLYYLDLRSFDFPYPYENKLPVGFAAFRQGTMQDLDLYFDPYLIFLFTWNREYTEQRAKNSIIGGNVTDYKTADLNRDGFDDIVSIDRTRMMLYWAFGSAEGIFHDMDWRDLSPVRPLTLEIADLDRDRRPDFLISGDDGNLYPYYWKDLFEPAAAATKVAEPLIALALPGIPADSAMADMDRNGVLDYVFSDITNNSLNVVFGNAFSSFQTYTAGQTPGAICIGDFDADGDFDAATGNAGDNSLSIFWNRRIQDGTFSFTMDNLTTGAATKPVDIEAADFDRNGKLELAVALETTGALAIYKIGTGGYYQSAQTPLYFYPDHPSSLSADNFNGTEGPDVLVGFSDYHELAFCPSNASGLLSFTGYLNTLGDVIVDPSENTYMSEDNILVVAGGTSYGGVSSRDGVAGLEEQPVNVVHFPRSKDLSFAVVNLAGSSALMNLELYNDNGILSKNVTKTINSGAQYAIYFTDNSVFGATANNASRWVRGFLTHPDTHGLWLANNGSDLTYLDGTKIPEASDAMMDFVLPVLKLGGTSFTTLCFINPFLQSANTTLTLMGRYGTVKATYNLLLNSRYRRNLNVATIFPTAAPEDYVAVHSDRAVIGFEMFGDEQKLSCLPGLPYPAGRADLFTPHVAVGDFGVQYQSDLVILNLSGQLQKLAAYFYDNSGTLIKSNLNIDIGPGHKQIKDVRTLFNLSGTTYTGFVKIVPPAGADQITGCVIFGEPQGGRFESCLPMQTTIHTKYLMGHLASGRIGSVTYFTGVAVLNTDDDFKYIDFKVYDQAGNLRFSKNVTMQARQRLIFLLDQFAPELGPFFGGYMTIGNSDNKNGVFVFQLFGDSALTFLSAVPAIPLD